VSLPSARRLVAVEGWEQFVGGLVLELLGLEASASWTGSGRRDGEERAGADLFVSRFPGGDTIVYRDFVDLSVAVATPKGLVTPVVRNIEKLGLVEIEKAIAELGTKVSRRVFLSLSLLVEIALLTSHDRFSGPRRKDYHGGYVWRNFHHVRFSSLR